MTSGRLDWHFPRTDLAESILDRFEIGATTALTLFAPRRMGKTEFVVQDLLPMARERGYLSIYVNFWDRKQDPADSLILGLTKATSQLSTASKIKQNLSRFKAGGIRTPIGGANLQLQGLSTDSKLEAIQTLFDRLLTDGRKLLIALDEVQHLGTNAAFEPIVYALRGLLDPHRDQVHVLYTGSSRSGLQRLFRRRNAPLFSSSQQIDLPEFGTDYLAYMAKIFQQATGRVLNLDACKEAFRLVKRVPYDYRQIIDLLILHGGEDILAITQAYLADHSLEAIYQAEWQALKPVDQAVLVWIIKGKSGPYTGEARQFIANQLGLDSVDTATVQNAVNRLRGASKIAPVSLGCYELEDPYYADWILNEVQHGT